MPYDFINRNVIYYASLNAANNVWLYFMPNHTYDITNYDFIKFPKDFIIVDSGCTNEYSFEDDLPNGLQKANVMTLSLNLKCLNTTELTYAKTWILEQQSATKRSIPSLFIELYIPNVWIIGVGADYNDLLTNQILFIGSQVFKTENEYIETQNQIVYNIDLVGIEKISLESITMDKYSEITRYNALNGGQGYIRKTGWDIYDNHWIDTYLDPAGVWDLYAGIVEYEPSLEFCFYPLQKIIQTYLKDSTNVEYFLQSEVYNTILRNIVNITINYDSINSNIIFYKVPTTANREPTASVIFQNLLVCVGMFQDSEVVEEGLLFGGESSLAAKCSNFWDFYKFICNNSFFSKTQFLYYPGLVLKPTEKPVFDRYTHIHLSSKDIILNEIKITQCYHIVSKGHATNPEFTEEKGYSNVTEWTYNVTGTIAEKEQGFEIPLINLPQPTYGKYWDAANHGLSFAQTLIVLRGLYYTDVDETLHKVHEYCKTNLESSGTAITTAVVMANPYLNSGNLHPADVLTAEYNEWMYQNSKEHGIGYLLAKAGAIVFGSRTIIKLAFKITLKKYLSLITMSMNTLLGYAVYLNDVITDYPLPEILVITKVIIDWVAEEVELTIIGRDSNVS